VAAGDVIQLSGREGQERNIGKLATEFKACETVLGCLSPLQAG
jgi:hypothetical protein